MSVAQAVVYLPVIPQVRERVRRSTKFSLIDDLKTDNGTNEGNIGHFVKLHAQFQLSSYTQTTVFPSPRNTGISKTTVPRRLLTYLPTRP
jgi:hypothetical protein